MRSSIYIVCIFRYRRFISWMCLWVRMCMRWNCLCALHLYNCARILLFDQRINCHGTRHYQTIMVSFFSFFSDACNFFPTYAHVNYTADIDLEPRRYWLSVCVIVACQYLMLADRLQTLIFPIKIIHFLQIMYLCDREDDIHPAKSDLIKIGSSLANNYFNRLHGHTGYTSKE